MKNFKWIGSILFFCLFLLSCTERNIPENWYMGGDDIKLYLSLKDKKIALFEKDDLIFDATIKEYEFIEKNKFKVNAFMNRVGEKYKIKYDNIKDFILWFEIDMNTSMKMIFSHKSTSKPYFFYSTPINADGIKYRLLNPYEIEIFKNSNFRDIRKDYNLEILVSKPALMTDEQVIKEEQRGERQWIKKENGDRDKVIRTMIDYMLDTDTSTCWATANFWNTEIEFFVKDSLGKNLTKPVKIRGVYLNTGNLYRISEYYNYHRAKDVSIAFSKTYEGSLGLSRANYNYLNYKVTLPDTANEKIIVFLQPIETYSIRLQFTDFYFGTKEAFALYDVTIYIDSE